MMELRLSPGEKACHVLDSPGEHVLRAEIPAGARLDFIVVATASSRHDIHVKLAGEGAECHLHAAAAIGGSDACDIVPVFEHLARGTVSSQTVRMVADGAAKATCLGRIIIRRGAAKADGVQSAKGVLRSARAEIVARPELEIYEDDVSCRHGAAVGGLDGDALFYMRSRGIPEGEASAMLLRAFLAEAFSGLADAALRESMEERMSHVL